MAEHFVVTPGRGSRPGSRARYHIRSDLPLRPLPELKGVGVPDCTWVGLHLIPNWSQPFLSKVRGEVWDGEDLGWTWQPGTAQVRRGLHELRAGVWETQTLRRLERVRRQFELLDMWQEGPQGFGADDWGPKVKVAPPASDRSTSRGPATNLGEVASGA